jgi:predicted acylesterase/phospholipase RssA
MKESDLSSFTAMYWPGIMITLLIAIFLPMMALQSSSWKKLGFSNSANDVVMPPRVFHHIIPPKFGPAILSNLTLREFILHPDGIHLALAPAFFGFFAQFGVMQAWEEELSLPAESDTTTKTVVSIFDSQIRALAGCSAGAMTAVLISSGIRPTAAAKFCSTVSLDQFADPPGILGLFRGDLFHNLMRDFMRKEKPHHSLQLQDSRNIPIAVTAFDLKSMSGKVLTRGSMPLAARASACFPFLFQPVSWSEEQENGAKSMNYFLVDGGITDLWGLEGLSAFTSTRPQRVVHIAVGEYDGHRGPKNMPKGVIASEVVSISIRNTPRAGPLAMENGPIALEASRLAMLATLDLPMYRGREEGHYIIHVDTSNFIPTSAKNSRN